MEQVASFAEAWIEIPVVSDDGCIPSSPPSRRRGLKSFEDLQDVRKEMSPPSRRRGLKSLTSLSLYSAFGRLLRGGVD